MIEPGCERLSAQDHASVTATFVGCPADAFVATQFASSCRPSWDGDPGSAEKTSICRPRSETRSMLRVAELSVIGRAPGFDPEKSDE